MKCQAYDVTKVDATFVLLTQRRRRILAVKWEMASEEACASVIQGEGLFVKGTGIITSAWRLAHFLASSYASNKKVEGWAAWDWRGTRISTSTSSSTTSFRRPWSCYINCEVRWQGAVAKLRLGRPRKYPRQIWIKESLSRPSELIYLWILQQRCQLLRKESIE